MKEMIGKKFGYLTVEQLSGRKRNGSKTVPAWLCRCECGETRVAAGTELRRGRIWKCEFKRSPEHADEYRCYHGMKARCFNPSNQDYNRYGGRGITISDRWLNGLGCQNGFQCFLRDMGRKPSSTHSVERRDNDGNYCPENCYWATPGQQILNRCNTRFIEVRGETIPLVIAAQQQGLSADVVRERIDRYGMSIEDALRPVLRKRNPWGRYIPIEREGNDGSPVYNDKERG